MPAQHGADLDQMDLDRLEKAGRQPGRAQGIGHQRAAAGAEFDQRQLCRRAHLLPDDSAPKPDEFTEDLRDLRRGDEIAGASDDVARPIVAELGIVEAQVDVAARCQAARAAQALFELDGHRRVTAGVGIIGQFGIVAGLVHAGAVLLLAAARRKAIPIRTMTNE